MIKFSKDKIALFYKTYHNRNHQDRLIAITPDGKMFKFANRVHSDWNLVDITAPCYARNSYYFEREDSPLLLEGRFSQFKSAESAYKALKDNTYESQWDLEYLGEI